MNGNSHILETQQTGEPNLRTMVGFVVTTKPDAAKEFYGKVLGFRLLTEDDYGIAFNANGALLRVGKTLAFTPTPNTILGWEVADITAAVHALEIKGINFEQYPNMNQDRQRICTFPNGDRVAWFKDPEGNVLSLSQHVISIADRGDAPSDSIPRTRVSVPFNP